MTSFIPFIDPSYEYVGSIPKLMKLGSSTPAGRYEMSLARIARYEILKARKESMAQAAVRFSMNTQPADLAFNYFYPLLVRGHHLIGSLLIPKPSLAELKPSQDIKNFANLNTDWTNLQRADIPRWTLLKMRVFIKEYFPSRVDVEDTKTELVRFLSYQTIDLD